MSPYKYMHRIVIGDWSGDGHSQKEFFSFNTTHDAEAIKKAYVEAVQKSGVALEEDTGAEDVILCDYEDNSIKEESLLKLKKLGVDLSFFGPRLVDGEIEYCTPEETAILFFEMVKTQIPGFNFALIKESCLNGFWSKDFNHGFGYGCFQ